jgi:hypothetical protein
MPAPVRGLMSSSAIPAVKYKKAAPLQAAPTPRRRSRMIRDLNIVAHEPDLLALVRELYSRRPEARYREAWELQHLLFSLSYSHGLVPEAEIAAAVEVARGDFDPEGAAA